MTEQSIRDELADVIVDSHMVFSDDMYDLADEILASPVIRRIQAEAIREASMSFIDWDVIHGHASETPKSKEGLNAAEWLQGHADRIEKGEQP